MVRQVDIQCSRDGGKSWGLVDTVEDEDAAREYVQELREDEPDDETDICEATGIDPTRYRIVVVTEETFNL